MICYCCLLYTSSNKKKDGTTDVYEAAPEVTPTFEGNQVRVTETVDNKEKTSYGGTIVKDKDVYKRQG